MGFQVCTGAILQCAMGVAPSSLVATPKTVMTSSMNAANITDHVPMVNIMPFSMCRSPVNPSVAAATTAAAGVLTPMPCIPNTPAPWVPGSLTVIVFNAPALNESSKLTCMWGGVISINMAGQFTHQIP